MSELGMLLNAVVYVVGLVIGILVIVWTAQTARATRTLLSLRVEEINRDHRGRYCRRCMSENGKLFEMREIPHEGLLQCPACKRKREVA